MKTIININDCAMHLVLGKTFAEWNRLYDENDCWDFPFEEFLNGAIEINEDIWYWYIDGRCYETIEEVN